MIEEQCKIECPNPGIKGKLEEHDKILQLIPEMADAVDELHEKIDDLTDNYAGLNELSELIGDLKGFVNTLQRIKEGSKMVATVLLFFVGIVIAFNEIGLT